MREQSTRTDAAHAVRQLAIDGWLRTGGVPADVGALIDTAFATGTGVKFNPYHDPDNGRFTFAPGGGQRAATGRGQRPRIPRGNLGKYYQGATASGVRPIAPVGGGYTDRNGRYLPEVFPHDPYRIRNPADALAHYVRGSGKPRNFYFNGLDTSAVRLEHFPEVRKILREGKPGLYEIADAESAFPKDFPSVSRSFYAATTIGNLQIRANGVLAIGKNGRYSFYGALAAEPDDYNFDTGPKRTSSAEASTTIGSYIAGEKYTIHIIGSRPFSETGPSAGMR